MMNAVYHHSGSGNPLIEAMPEQLNRHDFCTAVESSMFLPENLQTLTMAQRKRSLVELASVFVPLDYMYPVYDTLYRMIQSTYLTQTAKETVQRINEIFMENGTAFSTQAESGALLGTPGIGKSSCISRCLSLMTQVIAHELYLKEPFFCKQVLYLRVECPSDCSIKTLAFNIVQALDFAVGSSHLDTLMNFRSTSSSSASVYLKMLCLTYHVGVIVIDEVQNMVVTAQRSNRVKPLIRFLVELTNDTSTSIFFVGTPLAETVFTAEEHLRRRTRGIRLIPFKSDGVFRNFLEQIWKYQFTPEKTVLSDQLANKLYDYSGGIPDYVIKLFREAQNQALLYGKSKLDVSGVQQAAVTLNIKPPTRFDNGVSLSDFTGCDDHTDDIQPAPQSIPRFYAIQRGRRAVERNSLDLLSWYENSKLAKELSEHQLLEVLPKC